MASHHDLLGVLANFFLVLSLACVNKVLDILEGVVIKAAAERIMSAHQEPEAVEVLGANFHLVGYVMGEEVLKETVTLHP